MLPLSSPTPHSMLFQVEIPSSENNLAQSRILWRDIPSWKNCCPQRTIWRPQICRCLSPFLVLVTRKLPGSSHWWSLMICRWIRSPLTQFLQASWNRSFPRTPFQSALQLLHSLFCQVCFPIQQFSLHPSFRRSLAGQKRGQVLRVRALFVSVSNGGRLKTTACVFRLFLHSFPVFQHRLFRFQSLRSEQPLCRHQL